MGKQRSLTRRVDVVDLLNRLKIKIEIQGDDFIIARCPNKEHEDKNPSWKISDGGESNGLHYCFPCKFGGNPVQLVEHVNDCSKQEAIEFVKKSCGRSKGFIIESDGNMFVGKQKTITPPKGLKKIIKGSNCEKYLQERGIGKREIKRFHLLDMKWQRRVWVPITKDARLLAWLARSYNDEKPKVMTPIDNSNHSWAMFGFDHLDREKKTLHLSEGWISAIRVYQADFPNSIATCGSNLTEEQIFDLHSFTKIVVWQEGDLAGCNFSKQVKGWFRGKRVFVVRLPEGKDPADFSTVELRKFYLNRRKKNG